MVQVKDTMERLWIIWIVIGYLVNVGDTLLRAQCQHEGYFQTVHENYRLKYYVISSTDVQSLFDCVMACMNEGRCSSYNFQVSGNPLHKCELNSRSQSSAKPGSLELRNGFQYYEEVVHSEEQKVCESVSCFNGGSCEEKCVGFPYSQCRCPKGYTGIYCEKLESGNFLLKLTSNNVHDYSAVFVNRKKFKTFTSCVWLKPNSSEGVVFTYATKDDPMEMSMFFNQSSVIVHLSGVVIVKNLALPINKWSHLCIKLENGRKFSLYHNSYRVSGFVNITEKVVGINGDGAVVAGFKQTSPGKIVYSASSNLFLSRLYFWNYRIYELDTFRLYNEPQVSRFNKPSFVNWKMFYKPQLPLNTTVIYPAIERLQGNFDLKFSGLQQPVIINFTMVESKLNAFTLCLWVRTTNQADDNEPSLFTLKSGSDTIMKLVFISNEHKYDFTLLNVTWRIPGIPANGEWHHFCATWRKSIGVVNMFLNGIVHVAKSNIYSDQTLQEISSATVELGGSYFIGEMTDVNVWFKLFGFQFIGLLALQPGNAMGDLFAWTMLEENKDTRKVSPSAFPKRGDFDMKFPQPKENSVNYIYLESSDSIYTGHPFACSFWIKISLDASPFTLISYAIPSQVNEFNVHFGTSGIWVHVNGKKRFISIERQAIVGKWHHFLFNWYGHSGELACWHNNRVIFRDKGLGVGIVQRKDGVLVVGAQQTKYKIISKKEYQFYGQLSQLQVWVRNIHSSLARTFAARCSCIPGNFFSWSDMPVGINGTIEISHSSECLEIKNGDEE